MAESFGVEGRGKFYEEAGAIRDVVQNHYAGGDRSYLAMEPPTTMYPDSVRDEQVKVFRTIPPLSPANIVRGQFHGYREEPGVNPQSDVETFAAVRLEVDSWRWSGVPFLIRAGKCLAHHGDGSLRETAQAAADTRPATRDGTITASASDRTSN